MRGIVFSLEAAFTIFAIIAISSFIIISNNPPNHLIQYSLVGQDVADLAVEDNFWGDPSISFAMNSLIQQDSADRWSMKTGYCIKLKRDEYEIASSNCGELSKENKVVTDRVFFDALTGQMSSFTVSISPPG